MINNGRRGARSCIYYFLFNFILVNHCRAGVLDIPLTVPWKMIGKVFKYTVFLVDCKSIEYTTRLVNSDVLSAVVQLYYIILYFIIRESPNHNYNNRFYK